MKNKDFIKTLMDFSMDADIIILTKDSDIMEVNGQNVPGIKFGSIGNNDSILAIVGDYEKFRPVEENKEGEV